MCIIVLLDINLLFAFIVLPIGKWIVFFFFIIIIIVYVFICKVFVQLLCFFIIINLKFTVIVYIK